MSVGPIAFDSVALADFWHRMPGLFEARQTRDSEAYQQMLYNVEHEFSVEDLRNIEDAFELPHPDWGGRTGAEVIHAMDHARYPSAEVVGQVRAVSGMDLRTMSHYLHFFHHAYPIYDRDTCEGLTRLGVAVPYVKLRDPAIYGWYIEAIQALKDACPWQSVPEKNVMLTRIVQAAVAEFGTTSAARIATMAA